MLSRVTLHRVIFFVVKFIGWFIDFCHLGYCPASRKVFLHSLGDLFMGDFWYLLLSVVSCSDVVWFHVVSFGFTPDVINQDSNLWSGAYSLKSTLFLHTDHTPALR